MTHQIIPLTLLAVSGYALLRCHRPFMARICPTAAPERTIRRDATRLAEIAAMPVLNELARRTPQQQPSDIGSMTLREFVSVESFSVEPEYQNAMDFAAALDKACDEVGG